MKQRSKKIIASILAVIPFLVAVVPHPAFAFLGFTSNDFFSITALFSEFELGFAGSLVTITGTLLNAAMTATLNMASIVDSTPAIGIAWTTVRNFGSVFIIFMLLYASIKMILGMDSGMGKLIKNIVIAGLLINFSLFFTKLAVDASNIVSLSFYNAIAPTGLGQTGTTVNASNSGAGTLVGLVSDAFNDGGLSNVFMQSLDLQSFANIGSSTATTNSASLTAALNGPNKYWNITLANTFAAILMFFASISFLTAGLAFAVRIGVLIMLMAFSPIYFIAMIFPDLEKYSKKWTGMLYSMCIFMPAYLFLMYVAMSVLNDPHFFDFAKVSGNTTNVTGGLIGGLIGPQTIGTVLQYIIAIFMINAPLAAAISIAGEGSDLVANMMKSVSKWGQGAIIGSQKWVGRNLWRESGGRFANALAQNEQFKNFAGKSIVGEYALRGTRGIAANYNETAEKRAKRKDEFRESLGSDENKLTEMQDRIGQLSTRIAREKAAGRNTTLSESALRIARQRALEIETARAQTYAGRTEADTDSFGGLFNHLLRSNPVASAKAKIFVNEKQMKRAKENLDEQKKDLKELQKEINTSGTPTGPGNSMMGTTAQENEKKRILGEISKATNTVEDHESAIRNLELQMKKKI